MKFGTKHIVAAFSLNLDGNTELSVKKWEIREPYHSSSGYGEIVKSVGFDTDPDGYQILEHPTGTYNVKDLRPHGTGKQFVLTRTQ